MGLTAVTGVLSRYFVVGFFLPAYMSFIALWLSASHGFIPHTLERHSEGTELLILGGVALVGALLLSGLSYPLTRWAEGYPLLRVRKWPILGLLPRAALALQRRSYRRCLATYKDKKAPDAERRKALSRLKKCFPGENELLPTALGNAMRAYENHSNERWGLDGITIWPRIAVLLSDGERELHVDAKIDLNVFLNAAVGALAVGICLVVDKAVYTPNGPWAWALYAIPFITAYLLYRATIGAAVRRGAVVRSSIDLHRLELYPKLGIREPRSFSEERELGVAVSQLLLYGRPYLADDLWRFPADEHQQDSDDKQSRPVSAWIQWLIRR